MHVATPSWVLYDHAVIYYIYLSLKYHAWCVIIATSRIASYIATYYQYMLAESGYRALTSLVSNIPAGALCIRVRNQYYFGYFPYPSYLRIANAAACTQLYSGAVYCWLCIHVFLLFIISYRRRTSRGTCIRLWKYLAYKVSIKFDTLTPAQPKHWAPMIRSIREARSLIFTL